MYSFDGNQEYGLFELGLVIVKLCTGLIIWHCLGKTCYYWHRHEITQGQTKININKKLSCRHKFKTTQKYMLYVTFCMHTILIARLPQFPKGAEWFPWYAQLRLMWCRLSYLHTSLCLASNIFKFPRIEMWVY